MPNYKNIVRKLLEFHDHEIAVLICLVSIPVFIFFASYIDRAFVKYFGLHKLSVVEKSINIEKESALRKTKEAVSEGVIDGYIEENDKVNISATLYELAKKYELTTMVAVNKEGIALARISSPRTGDYVLKTTPWGRYSAKNESIVTTGTSRNFPMVITSAVPIMKDLAFNGALFGGYLLDDAFAVNFKKTYLSKNDHLVFYSRGNGLYGNSFNNEEVSRLLSVYFNEGSEWINNGYSDLSQNHFRINNKNYYVGNIILHGLDENIGGILVFIPARIYSIYILGILILISLLYFSFHTLREHSSVKKSEIITLSIAIIILIAIFFVHKNIISRRSEYDINKPPYAIYNSTITLQPESDILDINSEHRISVEILIGDEKINAVEALLKYDPKIAEVKDIIMTKSFCSKELMLEKTIDNDKGLVVVSCASKEAFAESKALVAELLIQPLREGLFDVRFDENITKVIAHDGLGTNVLRHFIDGSFTIIDSRNTKTANKPVLFSYTHPNQSRWYNKRDIHIDWSASKNSNFSYLLDTLPSTIPDDKNITDKYSMDFSVKHDGVYYFHVTPTNTYPKETSHYKIMIDSEPPMPLIKSSTIKTKINELVRFKFSGKDTLSGLQQNFYVKIDGGIYLPTLPQFYIPFSKSGKHSVTLRVFDHAGNFSESTKIITIDK